MQLPQLLNLAKSNALKIINLGVDRFSRSAAGDRYRRVYDGYEEFLGIKEVKLTQRNVLSAESLFADASKSRREIQDDLITLQEKLKQVRNKLDSTHRGDERYLELITNEHNLIKNELSVLRDLRKKEEIERDLFSQFSRTLRDAHEVERLRQEKSKYLSLVGSIVGAVLGIVAASINHSVKMKDFKKIIEVIETQNASQQLAAASGGNDSLTGSLAETNQGAPAAVTTSQVVRAPEQTSAEELAVVVQASKTDPRLAQLLSDTETNLEYKMKINSLATVVATYALIAITIPVLFRLIGD